MPGDEEAVPGQESGRRHVEHRQSRAVSFSHSVGECRHAHEAAKEIAARVAQRQVREAVRDEKVHALGHSGEGAPRGRRAVADAKHWNMSCEVVEEARNR